MLLCLLLVPLFTAYGALLYANPGHNVTLPCFFGSTNIKYLSWYKQAAGETPQIIATFYKHSPNSNTFENPFKDDKRFSVHPGDGFYHLNISNVQDSDSAMYYCGHTKITSTKFYDGTFLVLKDSSHRSFLKQPATDSVKTGGSVNLNCTVHAGTTDGQHNVYWFKKDSTSSHLGTMYIHTNSSNQCVKSSEAESPAQSCVYSLSKRSVSLSDAGTYYCALASCGEILFGGGTTLDVGEKHDDASSVLTLCVVAALLVSVILNIILISMLCKMSRGKHLHSGGLQPQTSIRENTTDSQNEEYDALPYVALDFKKRQSKSRRQRSPDEDTIYSGVRLSDMK